MKNKTFRFLATLFIPLSILSCNAPVKAPTTMTTNTSTTENTVIVPLKSVGNITSGMKYEDLLKVFGQNRLKNDTIVEVEGTSSSLTTIIDNEKNTELVVVWADSFPLKSIERIQIRQANSPFKTASGVGNGMTLAQLETVNTKPLRFSGFGWDFGGVISGFNGGRLDSVTIGYLLDLPIEGDKQDPKSEDLYGDSMHKTTDPLVVLFKDKIKIVRMEIRFK